MKWNKCCYIITDLLHATLKALASNINPFCTYNTSNVVSGFTKNPVSLPPLDHSFVSPRNISSITALWLTGLEIYCHFQLLFSLNLTRSPTPNHACTLFTASLRHPPSSSKPSASLLIHLGILSADDSACLPSRFLFIHWHLLESFPSSSFFYHVALNPDIL